MGVVRTDARKVGVLGFGALLLALVIVPFADGDGFRGESKENSCGTDPACQADLETTFFALGGNIVQAATGANIEMRLDVSNKGPSTVDGIVTTFTVSDGLTVTQAIYNDRSVHVHDCTGVGTTTITCPTGTDPLANTYEAGQTAFFGIDVTATKTGTLTTTAAVSSSVPDPNQQNNTATIALPFVEPGPCAMIIEGTTGNDTLHASTGTGYKLIGLDGNDKISGFEEDDCLLGGPGDDKITEEAGNDKLIGNEGDDNLVDNGDGNDKMVGGDGDDKLFDGGGGNDKLVGGPGKNSYVAGSGDDVINSRNGVAETVSCGAGKDKVKADKADKLKACEDVSAA